MTPQAVNEKTKITLSIASVISAIITMIGFTAWLVWMVATANGKVTKIDENQQAYAIATTDRLKSIEMKLDNVTRDFSASNQSNLARIAVLEAQMQAMKK